MTERLWRYTIAALAIVGLAGLAHAQAPLSAKAGVTAVHAPYELGECSICHANNDRKKPGPIGKPVNDLCFGCHEGIQESMASGVSVHRAAKEICTGCHNPHNSKFDALLHGAVPGLCIDCHDEIADMAATAKVKHDAVTAGAACLGCHDPHGTNVEHLLRVLPFDVCVNCHSEDDMPDDQGRPMINVKKLVETMPVAHGPVSVKDCSACHYTHGGEHFRMLVEPYPEKFYAPYDPANYALCFKCHNDQIVANAKTDTLTNFRDGNTNLHYLHVNKASRGRTCRACHEVHAAEQAHIVRDGVPYGTSGWVLPINYTPLPDGGSCEKTCHGAETYSRGKR